MRLINIHTLQFEEFTSNPPPYAILPHRWTRDEITYQDLFKDPELDKARHTKVVYFCSSIREFNAGYGVGDKWRPPSPVFWFWVDTCCIDKTSSAELTEAINSMWKWYKGAAYCVAYLADVEPSKLGADTAFQLLQSGGSEWFSRGWTLQELLAPKNLVFVTKNWQIIGHKADTEMMPIISRLTGIPTKYLQCSGFELQSKPCAAEKLSWAARRETSREEDAAYCLFGLLDVHLPLLYGERGFAAFRRLQEEFIRRYDDESIFAVSSTFCGILANRPSDFKYSGNVQAITSRESKYIPRAPYLVTNKGLQLWARTIKVEVPNEANRRSWKLLENDSQCIYLVPPNCRDSMVVNSSNSQYFVKQDGQCVMVLLEDNGGMAYRMSPSSLDLDLDEIWSKGMRIDEREFLIILNDPDYPPFWK